MQTLQTMPAFGNSFHNYKTLQSQGVVISVSLAGQAAKFCSRSVHYSVFQHALFGGM